MKPTRKKPECQYVAMRCRNCGHWFFDPWRLAKHRVIIICEEPGCAEAKKQAQAEYHKKHAWEYYAPRRARAAAHRQRQKQIRLERYEAKYKAWAEKEEARRLAKRQKPPRIEPCLNCGDPVTLPPVKNSMQYVYCDKPGCQIARSEAHEERHRGFSKRARESMTHKRPKEAKYTDKPCSICGSKVEIDYKYGIEAPIIYRNCTECRENITKRADHFNTDFLEHGASGFISTTRFAESLIAVRQSSFV